MLDLGAIERRAKGAMRLAGMATPGPWVFGQRKLRNRPPIDDHPGAQMVALSAPGQGVFTFHNGGTAPANDDRFIAAARADVPALTADVLTLAARVRELEAMCAGAYQVLGSEADLRNGECAWPDEVLRAMDNLAAAMQGEPIPHKDDDDSEVPALP